MFAVIALLMPFYTSIFHGWNIDKMDDANFSQKFGALYSGLNLDKKDSKRKSGLFFPFFFVLRRLLFFVAAIFLQQYTLFQLAIQFFCSTTMIIYLGYWWPFHTPLFTKIEIFNEVTTLLLLYHLFMFTDWIPMATIRYLMGWSFIAVTVMNLMFHLGSMVVNTVGNLKKKVRKVHYKYVLARSKRAGAFKGKGFDSDELSELSEPPTAEKKKEEEPGFAVRET